MFDSVFHSLLNDDTDYTVFLIQRFLHAGRGEHEHVHASYIRHTQVEFGMHARCVRSCLYQASCHVVQPIGADRVGGQFHYRVLFGHQTRGDIDVRVVPVHHVGLINWRGLHRTGEERLAVIGTGQQSLVLISSVRSMRLIGPQVVRQVDVVVVLSF